MQIRKIQPDSSKIKIFENVVLFFRTFSTQMRKFEFSLCINHICS